MKRIILRVLALIITNLFLCYNSFSQTFPTATQVASAMTVGWNIGNSLEATWSTGDAWSEANVNQRLIDSVKAVGFNTIRIPVAWDYHATNSVIDAAWFTRVKQVVDYCIGRQLYVIINIHWDGGWLENNCTASAQTAVNAKQKTYWTQIANYFKSYDEHLLFASANEPNVSDAAGMSVLLSYHQTFINAVRATGGNNSQRILIVQGPGTDTEKTFSLMNTMPTDNVTGRLMAEVHYYTPYQYCLMTTDASWGNMFYYWGSCFHSTTDASRNPTWGEESFLDTQFQNMKSQFVDKGIPVIVGEFGVNKRTSLTGANLTLHLASREYYLRYIATSAKKNGLKLVYWDPGFQGDNSTTLFDRATGNVTDRAAVNAIMYGVYGTQTTVSCNTNDCKGVKNGSSYTNSCGQCVLGFATGSSAPTVATPVTYCQGATASALTATGTALKWYTVATAGTSTGTAPTPSTTTTGSKSYYVSQTVGSCESPRATIVVTVNALPTLTPYLQVNTGTWTTVKDTTVVAGQTVNLGPQPTVATGWQWSGPNSYNATTRQISLTSITVANGGLYSVTYTDANGCKASLSHKISVLSLQTIALIQGWNIISLNVVPADSTVATIFNSIKANVTEVKNLDGFYNPNQNVMYNSLRFIEQNKGYLVNMKAAGSLQVAGVPLTKKTTILNTGWSLIGCFYQTTTAFSTDFNNTNCSVIKNFEGFWKPNGTANSISKFEPSKGYFIKK
jgi:hypothetical protein